MYSMKPRTRVYLVFAIASLGSLSAQSRKEFEAVSIRANPNADSSDTKTTPGRLSLIAVTPLSLVIRAFGVLQQQIIGAPGWLYTERYDILAVTGGADRLTDKERQPFMQAMLEDRFQFKF